MHPGSRREPAASRGPGAAGGSCGHGRGRRLRAGAAGLAGLARAAGRSRGRGADTQLLAPRLLLPLLKTWLTLAPYCKPLSAASLGLFCSAVFYFPPFPFPPPSFLLNPLGVISEVRAGRAESWKFAGAFSDGSFHLVGPAFMICA